MEKAFQDYYADRFSHCYGCGRLNPDGLQLKSYWDGDETIARFTPRPEQSGGVPNHVYGGLIASLLDCHGTASAAAFACRAANCEMEFRHAARPLRHRLPESRLPPPDADGRQSSRSRASCAASTGERSGSTFAQRAGRNQRAWGDAGDSVRGMI
jgi:hypothetical protein